MPANKTINYKIYSPGGNTTALVDTAVERRKHAEIAQEIISRNPEIEQVGFINLAAGSEVAINMAGEELCLNAARCAAWAAAKQSGQAEAAINFFALPEIRAKVAIDSVLLDLPKEYLVRIEAVAEGVLVDLLGIRFVVCSDSAFDPAELVKNYDDGKAPAIGVVFLETLEKNRLQIDPWIWVRKTATLFNETACGSGSIAACLALAKLLGIEAAAEFSVIQPSGSVYQIFLIFDNNELQSCQISGEVTYLGERQL